MFEETAPSRSCGLALTEKTFASQVVGRWASVPPCPHVQSFLLVWLPSDGEASRNRPHRPLMATGARMAVSAAPPSALSLAE